MAVSRGAAAKGAAARVVAVLAKEVVVREVAEAVRASRLEAQEGNRVMADRPETQVILQRPLHGMARS